MTVWSVPRMWKGSTVYILGGGPSLASVDIERLRGRRVIALNNAYRLANWFPMMYFHDCIWWSWHAKELASWPGVRVTSCVECQNVPWIRFLHHGNRATLDIRPQYLSRGSNAGFAGMSLAEKLGAQRIILLGYDMRVVAGQHNWHKDHQRVVNATIYQSEFIDPFIAVAPLLKVRGIEVINATPGSALTAFPIRTPEEVYPT